MDWMEVDWLEIEVMREQERERGLRWKSSKLKLPTGLYSFSLSFTLLADRVPWHVHIWTPVSPLCLHSLILFLCASFISDNPDSNKWRHGLNDEFTLPQ
ncbi:hypothetical protein CsSME_00007147 [Camellia sinensis var. sinensis]